MDSPEAPAYPAGLLAYDIKSTEVEVDPVSLEEASVTPHRVVAEVVVDHRKALGN
jgi:hypothetical protein